MHSNAFNHSKCHDSQNDNCNHKVEHVKNNCFSQPITAIDKNCIPHHPKPSGSRIAFSSGSSPATLRTAKTGLPSQVSQVGFGTAINTNTTDLPNLIMSNEAFTISQDGFITSIAATFVLRDEADFQTSQSVIRATIYKAVKGSNNFLPTAATVELTPVLTGLKIAGFIASGSTQVYIPVATEERLIMIFSLSQTNLPAGFNGGTINGFESAGITII